MPNRLLKESICTSEDIEKLNSFQEVLFYRLIVNCDDYSRMDGRLAVLKARLFPLKNVRTQEIQEGLDRLASMGCVARYEVDGRPYLTLPNWSRHQQIRVQRSKYPAPPWEKAKNEPADIICNQMISDVPVIQSESNLNPNPNPNLYLNPNSGAGGLPSGGVCRQ